MAKYIKKILNCRTIKVRVEGRESETYPMLAGGSRFLKAKKNYDHGVFGASLAVRYQQV